MLANNLDNKAVVAAWNKVHPNGKLRIARKARWNQKNLECPIDQDHPFFPIKWVYTPPVVGGSFNFPSELLQKYPFVFKFTKC